MSRQPDGPLDPRRGESRLHRLRLLALALLPILVIGVGFWLLHQQRSLPDEIVLGTGVPGGTYFGLGEGIAALLDRELEGISVVSVPTEGSTDNVDKLRRGEILFGFVQNDAEGDASLRTVARLYAEVLQVVVRRDAGIEGPGDLVGRRVSVGPQGSGTERLFGKMLRHYGISEADYQPFHRGGEEAVEPLLRGEVDAAVFLAGLSTPAVRDLLKRGDVRLLPVVSGETDVAALEGLQHELTGVSATVVPAHIYGWEPAQPVPTLSVEALLVTRREVPDHLVRAVTRTLFENRFELTELASAASEMEELRDSRGLRFPLHPGAAGYYARNDPPFVVVYAEAISLGLTLLLGAGSGLLALREWSRRRRKNRIDAYYLEAESIPGAAGLSDAPESQRRLVIRRLMDLRRRSFAALVAERVDASTAFLILQNHLSQKILELLWGTQGSALESAPEPDPDSGVKPAADAGLEP